MLPLFVLFSQNEDEERLEDNRSSFGFGNDSTETKAGPAFSIGGEISLKLLFFTDTFGSSDKFFNMEAGDIFEGKLNFSVQSKAADGIINLKIKPDFSGNSPISIDEAFLRVYLGPVDIEGGLRKLTWGRADSFGPLDVVNPLDFTDLSAMNNPREIKLARPMLHASWNINSFSKLEGVFVPWFAGNEYALSGRWAPVQVTGFAPSLVEGLKTEFGSILSFGNLGSELDTWLNNFDLLSMYSNSNKTLEYAQGGLRFTTTIGSSDFGVQYYFGRFPRPAYSVDLSLFLLPLLGTPPFFFNRNNIAVSINNNNYHHIGMDYAQVIAGFNLRAEAGANITNDLAGDDGSVYNPQLVWSLGFDRDIVSGINLNLQANGLIRLMYDKIGKNPMVIDTESFNDRTSTRVTAILSKKFFQDELELKATVLWGIEDKDFLVIPALLWAKNDITAELSYGIFGGNKTGELGQYRDNSYIKAMLTWKF